MRKIYITLFLALLSNALWAQDEMFKSLFIYNFTKNIEWPSGYNAGDFVITVFGNSPIVGELEKIAKLKKVGNQTIVVKQANDVAGIEKCHMLYIVPSKSSQLQTILNMCSSHPVVVIGDKEGMAKEGAGLNFIKVDGKQKFEINKGAIQKNGLKVNSYLTQLGIEVE